MADITMLNADFSRRAVVHAADIPWLPSPVQGIERRMLDRVGGEVARATSIVRYAAGSSFTAHSHGGGEEFLVLDGVFQDEYGDYPEGFYVRNPPGSSHTPRSGPGCTIFVKLWQFHASDNKTVRLDSRALAFQPSANRPGVASALLFKNDEEEVRLENWPAHTDIGLIFPTGGEILVLDGSFNDSGQEFQYLSWLRTPSGDSLRAIAGQTGCKVWIKLGGKRPE